MDQPLRINFVLPASAKITGGPLAILEYANRFAERGHKVTITTYPNSTWVGESPFPWFDVKGEILYVKDRGEPEVPYDPNIEELPFGFLVTQFRIWAKLIQAMPDCDLNIATWWMTTFPVFHSHKGKPVFFMQHYEELFYSFENKEIIPRLASRSAYALPVYKVANSSWLQRVILERYGQKVPWSNNGLAIQDFNPQPKLSDQDGVIRVVTYASPLMWKGFPDAAAAMKLVYEKYGRKVEWHVFGYLHQTIKERNTFAPYEYHANLSFKELAKLYATSDVALCPSWYESFPLPPLEAMASGTAVVTTAYGTEDYAFHEKNALVVGSRDSRAMADAICRLIEDGELRKRLAAEGRKTSEGFTWDSAVENREKILMDIHHGRHGYDVMKGTAFYMPDEAGMAFEHAPTCTGEISGLYWDRGSLFLMHARTRHLINRPDLVPELLDRGYPYIQPSFLDIERTPLGREYFEVADLPPGDS